MTARERHSDDPAFLLLKALITGQKIFYATSDGNINKKTIVCSALTPIPDQDGNQIHIVDPNSGSKDQTRDVTGATTGGTVNVDDAFDAQITEGTAFILTGIRSTPVELAAFETWVKTAIGDASGHTLTSLVAKWGDITRSLDLILGARWDAAGDLGTDVASIIADTIQIADGTLPASPVAGSLARYIASGGTALGTPLADSKSIVDAIGADGNDALAHDFSEAGIMQYLHGTHDTTYILFVIPEAVASINAHNAAIKASLEKLGRALTITQADALSYPDFNTYTLCVLGSNNGAAWTTSNLAHVKEISDVPIVCCDSASAAYLEMGTANANVVTTKALFGVANIEGSIMGMGLHGRTGLAVGTQDIADTNTTFASLNMSDADITEVYYGYETSDDNAHVLLGKIRYIQPDGAIGVDEEGAEIPGSRYFYGPAYSFNDLNTLGQEAFEILVLGFIHSKTIGHSIAISGEIRSLEKVLFGNLKNKFSNTNPLAKFIGTGGTGLGQPLPASTSLIDIIGNFTGPYSGAAQDDNIKASLDLAHTDLDTIITDIGALNNITAANVWELNISAYSGAGYAGTYLKTLYDDWVNGGRLDLLLDACSTHTPVNVRQSVCVTGDPASSIGKILYELYITRLTATRAGYLDELDFDLNARLDTKVAGKQQIAKTTEDLNQVIGAYDLFTGTTQDVILESLLIRMPNEAAGGAITSISIQTDDTTPQIFIAAADGVVANLTAEAQLAWQNHNAPVLIKTGTKIQLTIAGGAHGTSYVSEIIVKVRAITSGGYLA